MSQLLIAKPIIESSIEKLQRDTLELKNKGLCPKMGVILVGDNRASLSYIQNKKKMCQRIGAEFELIQLSNDISEKEFLEKVNLLNSSDDFTGCFIQLPVPSQLKHLDISTLINPQKDVDGFHSNSTIALYRNKENVFMPCTPKGIIKLLEYYQIPVKGKHVAIIGRSFIVGKPLSILLSNLDATVTLCHSKTANLKQITKSAQIIISAIGSPEYLDSSYLNDTNQQVIIDVGINRNKDDKLCGDVNFNDVQDKVSAITPVPGSVGPMTVLSLLENLILATKKAVEK